MYRADGSEETDDLSLVCSGIAKNAKNACAKSLGMVHDVYNEGEPSVGLFV